MVPISLSPSDMQDVQIFVGANWGQMNIDFAVSVGGNGACRRLPRARDSGLRWRYARRIGHAAVWR